MRFEPDEMCRKTREAEEARWLPRVIQPALAVLLVVFSLAAEGQVGPTERLSGPALVGSVTIVQVTATDAILVFAGQCKGNAAGFSTTLSPFNVATTTAASLEGLRLPGQGPAGCLSQAGGEDLIVTTVVTPKFVNTGTVLTAEAVLLFVVPR